MSKALLTSKKTHKTWLPLSEAFVIFIVTSVILIVTGSRGLYHFCYVRKSASVSLKSMMLSAYSKIDTFDSPMLTPISKVLISSARSLM